MSVENVNKNDIVGFVDDALAMEIQIHSLRGLADKLRSKAREINSRASQKWTDAERRLRVDKGMSPQEINIRKQIDQNKAKIKEIEGTLNEEIEFYTRMQGMGSLIGPMLVALLIVAFICAVIMAVVGAVVETTMPELAEFAQGILMAGTMILIFIVESIVIKSRNAKIHKKALKQAQEHVDKRLAPLQKQVKDLEAQLQNPNLVNRRMTNDQLEMVKKSCATDRAQATNLYEQANDCELKANEIENILKQCHEQSNIVPPDYRYIDCLVVLKHAFRNGLADNMKEAVLYYEQKEFRNQVIRGVNNIHDMLGQLANTMQEVKGVLNSIDGNINTIMYNQQVAINVEEARLYAEKEFHAAQLAHNKWVKDTYESLSYQ